MGNAFSHLRLRGASLMCALALLSQVALADAGPKKETKKKNPSHAGLYQIFEEAKRNPVLWTWWVDRRNDILRHGTEQKLNELYRNTSAIRDELMPAVIQMVDDSSDESTGKFIWSMQMAFEAEEGRLGSYEKEFKLLKQTARELGFPEEVVQDAKLFVPNDNVTLNGFTYTSSNKIRVVMYPRMFKDLDEEGIKAVFGHELTHALLNHIPVNMTTILIFLITGQSVIPAEEQDEQENLERLVKTAIKQVVMSPYTSHSTAFREGTLSEVVDEHFKNLKTLAAKFSPSLSGELKGVALKVQNLVASKKASALTEKEIESFFS